jgi:5-formyltetrahydrofolate cyclo-ligase
MTRTKTAWRSFLSRVRRELSVEARADAGARIEESLAALPTLAGAGCVLAYRALDGEVDPAGFVTRMRTLGIPVHLPLPREGRGWVWVSAAGEVTTEALGPFPIVAIVPGVGFDPAGRRLGRGAGFYDRTLAGLRAHGPVLAIGIAFDAQIVPLLPEDPWDQRVDVIVTERRVLDPRRAPAAVARTGEAGA